MEGGVPDEVGCPDEHEVDHDDIFLIGPSVEVVDGILEDDSQMIDAKSNSKPL
jgi:hypothetical protein